MNFVTLIGVHLYTKTVFTVHTLCSYNLGTMTRK